MILGCIIFAFIFIKRMHPFGALEIPQPKTELSGLAIEFKGATLAGWVGGSKRWSFESKSVRVSDDRRSVSFKGLAHGKLFDGKDAIASLSADKIVYNTYTQDIYSPQPVAIKFLNGPTLKAHNAYWNGQKSKLVVERGVEVHTANSSINGNSAEADFGNHELTLHGVSGQFNSEQ